MARAVSAQTNGPVSGQVALVQFHTNSTQQERSAVIGHMGGKLIAWLPQISVAAIRIEGSQLASLNVDDVNYVEYDLPISGTYTPNDPDFADANKRYGLDRIQASAAWDITKGNPDVIIAVLDSGIALNHPEFAGRIVPGYDFVNSDADPSDDSGHGTHAAGIIAAAIDDHAGVAGVCPHCRIMPVKVLDKSNIGSWATVTQGVLFAVDHGARVISLSLGSTASSQTLQAAIDYAHEHNVFVVAAAGNSGTNTPYYPAAMDHVVAVSATDETDSLWKLSNFGNYIDIAAPGHLVFSTYNDFNNAFHGYTFMSGTSMAAPFVAGVAGLLLSQDRSRTPDDLYTILTRSADDLGLPGRDPQFGYGRLNAFRALTLSKDVINSATPDLADLHQVFLPIIIN